MDGNPHLYDSKKLFARALEMTKKRYISERSLRNERGAICVNALDFVSHLLLHLREAKRSEAFAYCTNRTPPTTIQETSCEMMVVLLLIIVRENSASLGTQ